MKRLMILLCLAACCCIVMAQNTVESIRQRYTEMKNYIASYNGSDPYDGAEWAEYYHFEARIMLPATGGHKEDVYMYFGEKSGQEDVIYPKHYLKFASKKYNFAAREYAEEYLFDEDGNPTFIYAYDPMFSPEEGQSAIDMEYEFRFYFNKGKLIQAIIKQRANGEEAFKDVVSGKKLSGVYTTVCDQYIASAVQLLQLFSEVEEKAYPYTE